MLKRVQLEHLDDYFTDLNDRRCKGVYFYRINAYNRQIHDFVLRYYETARQNGVIIEGKLQNPDNNNLAYYSEIMGMDFQLSMGFISSRLQKWLPRMTASQRENVAGAIYDTLFELRKAGKNENMLKNAYIKFMCWLYYKFERIVARLGNEKLPKILYEGNISKYELLLMNVLAIAGCDIVLLQYQGDSAYLQIDPNSEWSNAYQIAGMEPFPTQFSLKQIQKDIQNRFNQERLYGEKPNLLNCTNAWCSGNIWEDVRKGSTLRGNDTKLFYNCFCRINGVEDRVTYENDLYQLQLELKHEGRHLVIVNGTIPSPTVDEISAIQRKNYHDTSQMIMDLSANIRYTVSRELQRIMVKAFVDLFLEESGKTANNVNRLTNKAVYLLCWLKRYSNQLFPNWKSTDIACFFHMGGCQNDNEALFCRFLARLPVDVLLLKPNRDQSCCLTDSLLYEVNYVDSLHVETYPENNAGLRVGTSAYHAERDLDTLMYQDTGLYRDQQYDKANVISLQTMYEEIEILWDQELKYRANFSIVDNVVNLPVVFSKICGVKDGNIAQYWNSIKKLITQDSILITKVPNITRESANPIKAFATDFLKNGKLQRRRIKTHKAYSYSFLRESVQEYILDKLQTLIDQKLIKGMFENGTEYTVVATALNLDKNILRMIQKFDFTKKNPKLIYVVTGEKLLSLEDAIQTVFLHLLGFDIVLFVPTGYQCIEQFLTCQMIEEHQIGEYQYDLQVPDFDRMADSANTRHSWREFIFKRGI